MNAHPISTGEEPRHFERLITDISLPFISSNGAHLDTNIDAALKAISGSLRLDYSALAQWDKAAELFVITHCWVANKSISGRRFSQKEIPWLAFSILRGKSIQFGRSSKFSSEAAKDVETVCHSGIESAFFLPLKFGDEVLGFVCFACSRADHKWPEDIGNRLHVIAEVFANSLARIRSEDELVQNQERRVLEAEERLRLAIESFPTAVIVSNQDGTMIRVNSRTALTFGYTQDELLGNRCEMLVPPRLREQVNRMKFAANPTVRPMGTGQELWGLRKDGTEFQADVALSPMQTRDGILILSAVTDITDRKISEQAIIDLNARLAAANEQIRIMKEDLEREQVSYKHEIKLESSYDEIVGQSEVLLRVLMNAEQVAPTDSAVLLLGETGSGKELVARAIHKNSKRGVRSMVNVNCAALPASLVENELFGRERGAYTGALTREIGRFELANHSTIFLDEVGELPLELQAKLLRVLQEGEFERLGSSKTIHVDVRLIAATSRDLEAAVREGKFREDLFYRLNVFPIRVPPLRERRDDIPMLTWHFLQMLGSRMGRDISSVRASTMKAFQAYAWPGNVRELRNVIERSLIIHQGPVFEAELPGGAGVSSIVGTKIEEVDRDHIFRILERTGWRVRGSGGAAEALGLKPTTLEARMKKLGVVRK